jgi:hypothetical protein
MGDGWVGAFFNNFFFSMHVNLIQKDLSFLLSSRLSYQVGQTRNKSKRIKCDISLDTIVEPWLLGFRVCSKALVPLQSLLHSSSGTMCFFIMSPNFWTDHNILLHSSWIFTHVWSWTNPKPWANPCRGASSSWCFMKHIRFVCCSNSLQPMELEWFSGFDFTKNVVTLGLSFLKTKFNSGSHSGFCKWDPVLVGFFTNQNYPTQHCSLTSKIKRA